MTRQEFNNLINTEKALKWIVNILDKYKVPFQITGGLAARIYGSERELADIDIEISDSNFEKITPEIKDYIIFGPDIFKDENWDLLLMTLKYENQEIDICGADSAKIFNQNTKNWEKLNSDLLKAVIKEVYKIKIPVIPIENLIKYKSKMLRNVDKEDISFLKFKY